MKHTNFAGLLMAMIALIFLSGCSSAYYATMEKFGKEKRHLLIDNVEDVQESQKKAQKEFKDALTRIKELYAFDGGNLESFYNKLKDSYEDCDSRANQIEKRINDVEKVAKDLFTEWEAEIDQINDVKLKNSSKDSLRKAKIKYRKLKTVMTNPPKGCIRFWQNLKTMSYILNII